MARPANRWLVLNFSLRLKEFHNSMSSNQNQELISVIVIAPHQKFIYLGAVSCSKGDHHLWPKPPRSFYCQCGGDRQIWSRVIAPTFIIPGPSFMLPGAVDGTAAEQGSHRPWKNCPSAVRAGDCGARSSNLGCLVAELERSRETHRRCGLTLSCWGIPVPPVRPHRPSAGFSAWG